jgi:hypothetical protein
MDVAFGREPDETSGNVAPSPEWTQFVKSCEEVISAENRGWMAKTGNLESYPAAPVEKP